MLRSPLLSLFLCLSLLTQGCPGLGDEREEFVRELLPKVDYIESHVQGTTTIDEPGDPDFEPLARELLNLLFGVHNTERTSYRSNQTEEILNASEYVRLSFSTIENIELPNYRSGIVVEIDEVIAVLVSSKAGAPVGRLLLCSDLDCGPYGSRHSMAALRSLLS